MPPSSALAVIKTLNIGSGSKVRCTMIDSQQYLSIRDLIMFMCVKNINDAAEVWRKISPELKKGLQEDKMLAEFQFKGRGQHKQPMVTFQGAIKLLMWLPGTNAKLVRNTAAHILTRYCEGDESLQDEISQNRKIGTAEACVSLMTSQQKRNIKKTSIAMAGWVYGTHSKAFSKMIKIGRAKYLKQRICSGNTFCAPAKHSVVAAVPSFNPVRDEKLVHEHFARKRCVGEFFYVTQKEVQSFFDLRIMPQYQHDLLDIVAKFRSP